MDVSGEDPVSQASSAAFGKQKLKENEETDTNGKLEKIELAGTEIPDCLACPEEFDVPHFGDPAFDSKRHWNVCSPRIKKNPEYEDVLKTALFNDVQYKEFHRGLVRRMEHLGRGMFEVTPLRLVMFGMRKVYDSYDVYYKEREAGSVFQALNNVSSSELGLLKMYQRWLIHLFEMTGAEWMLRSMENENFPPIRGWDYEEWSFGLPAVMTSRYTKSLDIVSRWPLRSQRVKDYGIPRMETPVRYLAAAFADSSRDPNAAFKKFWETQCQLKSLYMKMVMSLKRIKRLSKTWRGKDPVWQSYIFMDLLLSVEA